MAKIVCYPAVITKNQHYFTVTFPDVPSAISQGKTLAQACYRAQEALALALYDQSTLPKVSDLENVNVESNQIKTLVAINLTLEAKRIKNVKVRKNVSIDASLALEGEQQGLNFSEILNDGLKERLSDTCKN